MKLINHFILVFYKNPNQLNPLPTEKFRLHILKNRTIRVVFQSILNFVLEYTPPQGSVFVCAYYNIIVCAIDSLIETSLR